jgi:hypothetical protein
MEIIIFIIFEMLFGCKTWSPNLIAGHRLSLFEKGMLRIIVGRRGTEIWHGL